MNFPVVLHIGDFELHPHRLLEGLAYIIAIGIWLHRRHAESALRSPAAFNRQIWLLVGAVFGGLVGAHLLPLAERPNEMPERPLLILFGAKTVLGGIIGGWCGVEAMKRLLGVRDSTGDGWVFSLCAGIAVGRLGCFLTGLEDGTYGIRTSLPWGVDFGDGVPRHPTQLYEAACAVLLFLYFSHRERLPHRRGELFRQFILAYALFRLAVEFIKPTPKPIAGLSAIQVVASVVIVYLVVRLLRLNQTASSGGRTAEARGAENS